MKTTYWSWKGIPYRLRDNAIPEIWNAREQGWQLTNVLMGLIVGGDPTLDQVTAEEIEAVFPGSTAEDAAIIEITAYPFP
jgi:hypothetical protein